MGTPGRQQGFCCLPANIHYTATAKHSSLLSAYVPSHRHLSCLPFLPPPACLHAPPLLFTQFCAYALAGSDLFIFLMPDIMDDSH